jgi:type 2 lantibiotic biosynthesis protein LanM
MDEETLEDQVGFWSFTLGSEAALARRLEWAGIERSRLGALFASASGECEASPGREATEGDDEPPPSWASTLAELLGGRSAPRAPNAPNAPIAAGETMPFEELLLPMIDRAAVCFEARLPAEHRALLLPEARAAIHRALLVRLAQLGVRAFQAELEAIELPPDPTDPRRRYRALCESLAGAGMADFFARTPVLARLFGLTAERWLTNHLELVARFAEDRRAIEAITGPFEAIAKLEPLIGDPHNGGRTVAILIASSGKKIVYKPKPLDLEALLSSILARVSSESGELDLVGPRILLREGYGWAEFITAAPCADRAAAERFYRRAGMLEAILYVLGATDCHHENLIAAGEHPVLIDAETLLHPEAISFEGVVEAEPLVNSVTRSGMLPAWIVGRAGDPPLDTSALGGANVGLRRQTFKDLNTDTMALVEVDGQPMRLDHRPHLDGRALDPADFEAPLLDGFARMYRFLLLHRDSVVKRFFSELEAQPIRVVFRNTRVYGAIQGHALRAELLSSGVDRSIGLDLLARAYLVSSTRPAIWPVLAEEIRALEDLDVPLFLTAAGDRGITLSDGTRIERCFLRSAFEIMNAQAARLSEQDLGAQQAIIRAALFAWRSRPFEPPPALDPLGPEVATRPNDRLIDAARAIAHSLEAQAMWTESGDPIWIGIELLSEVGRHGYAAVPPALGNGSLGIALFLATLARLTDDVRASQLARAAIRPVEVELAHPDWQRKAPLGGTIGLGATVYGLTRLAALLEDRRLIALAEQAAQLLTAERAGEDQQFDVVSGSAGAVLGLLALQQRTGDPALLARARLFGDRLLAGRTEATESGEPFNVWETVAPLPLTGFSHGAAGIAYALAALHQRSGEAAYRDAAQEAVRFERALFSASARNWPDRRPGAPPFANSWCHGAPGIGLARLGAAAVLGDVEPEVEVAIEKVRSTPLDGIDHLCCGNVGRLELLIAASARLDRPELLDEARRSASQLISRADRSGYQLQPGLPRELSTPGLYQGLSGIGYQLLRLASPDAVPSVLLFEG